MSSWREIDPTYPPCLEVGPTLVDAGVVVATVVVMGEVVEGPWVIAGTVTRAKQSAVEP